MLPLELVNMPGRQDLCRRLVQGIIVCTGTETRQIFFSYVCNGKKIEELFVSALNVIPASVRCVSSTTPVVPKARLAD